MLVTGAPCILDDKELELGQVRTHREVVVLKVVAPDLASHWILAGVYYFD